MRCIAPLIALCLLCAGAAPRRAVPLQPRHDDAIAAAKALAKVAARRTDGARPLGKLVQDPVALAPVETLDAPPRVTCAVTHVTLRTPPRLSALRVMARGPPLA